MDHKIKKFMILLVFILTISLGSTLSYAWDGHQGHWAGAGHYSHGSHGYGGYGHGNVGIVFNYAPDYYPYSPYYYDPSVLVSSSVVDTPEVIVQPSDTVVSTAAVNPATGITPVVIGSTDVDNEFTINIPNSSGGYTSVVLKRTAKGFIGPQGEFYPEFPKVAMLKVIYGNK